MLLCAQGLRALKAILRFGQPSFNLCVVDRDLLRVANEVEILKLGEVSQMLL